jgi:hypothetical protein
MTNALHCVGILAALSFVLMAGVPTIASGQEAVLYEIVENLDTVHLQATGERVSYWTAQGTAQGGSPFCPAALSVPTCTITAFGTDSINLTTFAGTVWANVVAVANLDNVVDAPEAAVFSGQITGTITIFPIVELNLGKKKALLGPALPLIYITGGHFFPDALPTVRTSQPSPLPSADATATFESTFRLPFNVVNVGETPTPVPPEKGRKAFYLGDDGNLIKVDKEDEFALGFPLLRGEVFFTTPQGTAAACIPCAR